MGGIAGCLGGKGRPIARVARMLLAPSAVGRPIRRTSSRTLCTFGARDTDLVDDVARSESLAVSGYVRMEGRLVTARDVLEAWRAEGEKLLDRLAGEFALAVRCGDRLVVARDALGTRPMYVADIPGGGAAFSTSLFALVHAGANAEVDYDAVIRSLVVGYPVAPGTGLRGVRQLGPGEVWELLPRRAARRWYAPRERLDRQRSLDDAATAVDLAVTRAVTEAIPSHARVAAFLSGGIDSSLVLARLHETGTPVEAHTLFFGAKMPGELRYARAVAQHLGVQHHVLEVDARRFCDGIEPTVRHLEDVVSEAIAIPNYLLAREAAASADVLFTGEGGDQGFGGPKNIGMALARAYQGHPGAPPLAESYASLYHYLGSDLREAIEPGALAHFDARRFDEDVAGRFFGEGTTHASGSFIGSVMIGNTVLKGGSNILVKAAKTIGLAHDVALRSPMFDRALIDLAFSIPPWHKMDGTDEKLVLRRAALRSLPAWVVNRPKRGMTLPLGFWFEGALGQLAHDVLEERAVKQRGLFQWEFVKQLLDGEGAARDHARGRTIEKLWLVLMTELHHRSIDAVAHDARLLAAGSDATGAEQEGTDARDH